MVKVSILDPIKMLQELGVYPRSGYGEITLKIQNDKIVLCFVKETIKLDEEKIRVVNNVK